MSDIAAAPSGRFLKIADVVTETSLSRATIYRLVAKGEFPAPIRVSAQRVAWVEEAVQGWKARQASDASNLAPWGYPRGYPAQAMLEKQQFSRELEMQSNSSRGIQFSLNR
ncbi:AlpA family phage regulatory protein [uncultured Novosphingobium sp.]|uniref:helix-turn-helix transcriptional regulator n=1 Tax=uncultured Novosphingobium sp. TaxID=292277 RepID=UPI0025914354|nr:AlpA family phage regulatory protein [uncultured Novosphingobium sp.]